MRTETEGYNIDNSKSGSYRNGRKGTVENNSYHVGNPATLPLGSRSETLRPPLSESLPFSVVIKYLSAFLPKP
jgi:hypothetical protein